MSEPVTEQGTKVSVEHTVTVETSQMSAFQFRSTTLRFSISLMKPTWDYVIVGSGLTTESLELKNFSQRNSIRQECPFIKGDPMTFWGLSENAENQGGKRWKVKCWNVGMWRPVEGNVWEVEHEGKQSLHGLWEDWRLRRCYRETQHGKTQKRTRRSEFQATALQFFRLAASVADKTLLWVFYESSQEKISLKSRDTQAAEQKW